MIDLQQLTEEKKLCFIGVLFVFWGIRGGFILCLCVSNHQFITLKRGKGGTGEGGTRETNPQPTTGQQDNHHHHQTTTTPTNHQPKNDKKTEQKILKQHPHPKKNMTLVMRGMCV